MKKFYAGMILAGMMAAALAITGCPSPTGGQTTYSISLDQTGTYVFSEAAAGYGPQTAKTVTVSNTGNQATGALTVGKSGANPDSFTVSKSSLNSIAAGGNDSFTVVPAAGLAAGTHTATITVSGGNNISASFNLSFTVTATAYGIGLSQTGTYTFPGAAPGYEAPNALTITVSNTGTQATGALTIEKSGANAAGFTVSKTSLNSIAAGGNDSFTVVPVTGLTAETYAATITVSGGNGISASFNVSFAVTVPVEYGIVLSETGTYAFLGAVPGYEAPSAKTVTVSNIGVQATGALTIAKSGANPGSFTVSKTSLNSIAAGGNDSFTVVPVTGLANGTYTATITVSGGNDITAEFNVSFTVDATFRTVTFDSDGGSPATSTAQTTKGATVSLPTVNPTKTGYTFRGWYMAKNGGGAAFSETTPVTEDLTVYARWLSANANLSSLSIEDNDWLNPTFSPSILAYTMTVPYTTSSLTVSATVWDTGKASLEFLSGNTVALNPGENTVRVRVTAEDGTTTQVYTITVTRTPLSANANLGSLSVSVGDLNPAFSANITAYTVLVLDSVNSFTVNAAVADTGKATLNQSPPNPVTLSTNPTVITLTVTAEDGTTKDYTVTVHKTTATNAVNVTISMADEHIDLTKSTENDLSREFGDTLRLTAPEGYTNYTWFVDMGSNYHTISDRIIEHNPNWYGYSYGTHSVLLRYEKDGIPYGCEVLFRVVR